MEIRSWAMKNFDDKICKEKSPYDMIYQVEFAIYIKISSRYSFEK